MGIFNRLPPQKTEAELNERYDAIEREGLEKNDLPAMILAGFIAFAPIIIAIIAAMALLLWIFRAG